MRYDGAGELLSNLCKVLSCVFARDYSAQLRTKEYSRSMKVKIIDDIQKTIDNLNDKIILINSNKLNRGVYGEQVFYYQ